MKIKETINFKKLRSKGPSSIDVKDDEIVQLVSRGKSIKYIVDAQHYLDLYTMKETLLINKGLKRQTEVNSEQKKNILEKRFNNIANLVNSDNQLYGCVANPTKNDELDFELLSNLIEKKEDLSKIKLVEEKVLSYYDGPKIFVAKDPNTNLIYLVYYKDDERNENYMKENFFLVRTSNEKIKELEDNKIDINSWVKSHFLFIDYSIIYEVNKLPQETFKQTSFKNLVKEKAIPDQGVFLGEDPNKKIEDALFLVENYLKSAMDNKKDKLISNVYVKFLTLKKELTKKGE